MLVGFYSTFQKPYCKVRNALTYKHMFISNILSRGTLNTSCTLSIGHVDHENEW